MIAQTIAQHEADRATGGVLVHLCLYFVCIRSVCKRCPKSVCKLTKSTILLV
ncbi:hypothetical protein HanIR_Chr04g0155131 [Helianthus annuus]|nr:hypothetical protein HanIR_Chr04g0155131 [Helianthus annuus]